MNMKQNLLQVLQNINSENNNCFDLQGVDLDELKDAVKEEGLNKHSSLEELHECVLELFDSVGVEGFGIKELAS